MAAVLGFAQAAMRQIIGEDPVSQAKCCCC
eukprot:COSAG06_NODE_6217_length_3044_cov_23.832008_6_plen_29_part_01